MTVRIMLVEDSLADAELMRAALEEALPGAELSVVEDGEQALAALLQQGEEPDLVLLDLNLPRLSGHEVLSALRAAADPRVRRLPVIILTTSDAPGDVQRSYDLAANSHITKPHALDELFEVVACIGRYWFGTVTLP